MNGLVVVVVLVLGIEPGASQQQPEASAIPEDQPLSFLLHQMDPLIEPCVRAARKSFGGVRQRFTAGLPEDHELFVTTRLRDTSGQVEQVFVLVEHLEVSALHGRIWSEILVVEGYESGQPIEVKDEELIDWLVRRPDGSEEGNLVGKYLDRVQATLTAEPCQP